MQQKISFPPDIDCTTTPCKRQDTCGRRPANPSLQSSDLRHHARARDQFYTRDVIAEMLVQKTRKVCLQYDPGGIDHFRIIEPSAGTGVFLPYLPVHTEACDKDPKDPRIMEADFLRLNLFSRSPKPTLFIGNPPFGRNASLAIKFFNHAATVGDIIAFIVPLSFRKASIQNRLNLNFHLLDEMLLPKDAFIFDGKPKHVPTVFQIWVKKEVRREKINLQTDHPDLTFTTRELANIAIPRVGNKAGCIIRDFSKCPQSSFFIRADPEALKILESLDLQTTAMNTTGQRSLAKSELVALYAQRKRELAEQSLCANGKTKKMSLA